MASVIAEIDACSGVEEKSSQGERDAGGEEREKAESVADKDGESDEEDAEQHGLRQAAKDGGPATGTGDGDACPMDVSSKRHTDEIEPSEAKRARLLEMAATKPVGGADEEHGAQASVPARAQEMKEEWAEALAGSAVGDLGAQTSRLEAKRDAKSVATVNRNGLEDVYRAKIVDRLAMEDYAGADILKRELRLKLDAGDERQESFAARL